MARNTKVILAKGINLDKNYKNVLNYSESQMLNLVNSKKIYEADDCSFIRERTAIQVNCSYGTVLQCNYLAFQNPYYSNKWFFGFIDEVKYISNAVTEIVYTIDIWSTWFSYWNPTTCFVSREHVNDDTIGLHTVPENIDVGDMIIDHEEKMIHLIGSNSFYWIVIASNYDPADNVRLSGISMVGRYPQGSHWFAWRVNKFIYAEDINSISQWIYSTAVAGHSSDIQSMFILPDQALETSDVDSNHKIINNNPQPVEKEHEYPKHWREYSLEDESDSIKNNKLFTYPYSFIRISNNVGSYNDYKFENFTDEENMTFKLKGTQCIGFSSKITPVNYKTNNDFGYENEDEAIMIGKYPTLSWSSDSFTNWLTQNAVNLSVGAISNAISSGIDIATGNVGAGIGSIASGIANQIGQIRNASFIPNTAQGNANSGDLAFIFGLDTPKIIHFRPKDEYVKIIDSYFTRFGYKVNSLKVPNLTGRRNWNYVEINSGEEICNSNNYNNISVPTNSVEKINSICQAGVTVWHSHDNIGNFDLENDII